MFYYECYDNGEIKTLESEYDPSRYCIVEKYEIHYQSNLPRFKEYPFRAYALPYADTPEYVYRGIGCNTLNELDAKKSGLSSKDQIKSLADTEHYLSLYKESNQYDIVYTRVVGSTKTIPDGFYSVGYDITYLPQLHGSFSIICDCMFVCKWHGCDEDGTAFQPYFDKLNTNGLFDDQQTAYDYMVHYLSFDWSERGNYYISEIYRN